MPYKEISFHVLTYILEDDPDILELIEEMVRKSGISNVKIYTNPSQFLEEMTSDISISVIDHRLPEGLTGLDIIKAVKSKNKYSYVIIMSGQSSKDVVEEYLNAGADKYIDKNKGNYLERLVEKLKLGFFEAKERIDTEKMRHDYAEMMKESMDGTKKLINDL